MENTTGSIKVRYKLCVPHPHYIFDHQHHPEALEKLYNIRRSIICHLACYGKAKNISGLIYIKIYGVLKVSRENMIQGVITHANKHDKQQTSHHWCSLLKHRSMFHTHFKRKSLLTAATVNM